MNSKNVWWFLSSLTGLFILIQVIMGPSNYGHLDVVYHANLLKTENDLTILINALENFRKDVNRYPSTKEGLNALISQPLSNTKWKGPYVTLPKLAQTRDINKDPWGTKYIYIYPAKYGDDVYDLYSSGKNKKDDLGQQDDISNWKGSNKDFYGKEFRLHIDPLLQFKAFLLVVTTLIIFIFLFRKK